MKTLSGIPSGGSVPFMFGVADADALPGPVLSTLLNDVGMSPAGARALLARLKERGSLTAIRHGRVSVYRLGGRMRERFDVLRAGPEPISWGGAFGLVVYDIPESQRSVKDRLRHSAERAGLGSLRSGVFVSAEPATAASVADDVRSGLATDGSAAGVVLETGTLELSAERARDVAATAWQLSDRAEALSEQLAVINAVISEESVADKPLDVFRRLYDLYMEALKVRLLDPGLPAELLPPNWKAAELAQAMGTLIERWDSPLSEHVNAVIDATGYRGLVGKAAYTIRR